MKIKEKCVYDIIVVTGVRNITWKAGANKQSHRQGLAPR